MNEETNLKLPKQGEEFEYRGMKFTALDVIDGGVLAIVSEPLENDMPFDKAGKNDWRKSTLRKFLNEEHIKHFDEADLIPFQSDLIADDGMQDYGATIDCVFLLSCDLYRKYRDFVPQYKRWWWTLTPWSCKYANFARIVYADGTVYCSYADNSNAVAPACHFNQKIFK